MNANSILITGGSDGIGFGLAKRFIAAGDKVLITGRSLDKLQSALKRCPDLHIFQNDISKADHREALAAHVKQTMPGINMIINNAGIQRRVALAADQSPWPERQGEIDILFSAPIHLNDLLIPQLLSTGRPSVIINVTSGGAYIPQPFAPVYSACKAALHSYTMTLRHSLSETGCRVIELIPPAVKTSLTGAGPSHGADLDEFCDAVFEKIMSGDCDEIGFGPTSNLKVELNDKPMKEVFETSALRFLVSKYKPE